MLIGGWGRGKGCQRGSIIFQEGFILSLPYKSTSETPKIISIRYDEWFDPTFISDRMVTPWSDVRFRGHLRGRSIPVLAMHSQGFKFLSHPQAFVVHRAHDQSRARLLYNKVRLQQTALIMTRFFLLIKALKGALIISRTIKILFQVLHGLSLADMFSCFIFFQEEEREARRCDVTKHLRKQMQLQQRGKARRLPDDLIFGAWEWNQTLLSHDSYLQVS